MGQQNASAPLGRETPDDFTEVGACGSSLTRRCERPHDHFGDHGTSEGLSWPQFMRADQSPPLADPALPPLLQERLLNLANRLRAWAKKGGLTERGCDDFASVLQAIISESKL